MIHGGSYKEENDVSSLGFSSIIMNTVKVLQGFTASHHFTAGDNRRDA